MCNVFMTILYDSFSFTKQILRVRIDISKCLTPRHRIIFYINHHTALLPCKSCSHGLANRSSGLFDQSESTYFVYL